MLKLAPLTSSTSWMIASLTNMLSRLAMVAVALSEPGMVPLRKSITVAPCVSGGICCRLVSWLDLPASLRGPSAA